MILGYIKIIIHSSLANNFAINRQKQTLQTLL